MSGNRILNAGVVEPAWGGLQMIMEEWSPHALRHAFAASLPDSAGLGERRVLAKAGRSLAARVEELRKEVSAGELEAYRAYLGEVVTTVSPLLLRVCELEGRDLDELVCDLRPGMIWEQWLCGIRPRDAWLRTVSGKANARRGSAKRRAAAHFQEYVHGGRTVGDRNGPGIPFGIRVVNCGLEMAAFLGEHRIRTHGREGSITLCMELPHTVMAALPGVELDRLAGHPLLAGVGCVVTGVDEPTRWGTKIRFALDPVPWCMPWARGPAK